jgi:hypothetical protein
MFRTEDIVFQICVSKFCVSNSRRSVYKSVEMLGTDLVLRGWNVPLQRGYVQSTSYMVRNYVWISPSVFRIQRNHRLKAERLFQFRLINIYTLPESIFISYPMLSHYHTARNKVGNIVNWEMGDIWTSNTVLSKAYALIRRRVTRTTALAIVLL